MTEAMLARLVCLLLFVMPVLPTPQEAAKRLVAIPHPLSKLLQDSGGLVEQSSDEVLEKKGAKEEPKTAAATLNEKDESEGQEKSEDNKGFEIEM